MLQPSLFNPTVSPCAADQFFTLPFSEIPTGLVFTVYSFPPFCLEPMPIKLLPFLLD